MIPPGDTEQPAAVDGVKLAALAALLYITVRCLNLKSSAAPPVVTCQDSAANRYLLKCCPLLSKEYTPPLLWGKNGHLQTLLYAVVGRVTTPTPRGRRKFLLMPDGATATFDLFEASSGHACGGDLTMAICPGIGSHSQHRYVRTFVDYAQRQGYRCAVLNHLGAPPDVELTSPRIFTYGCTWEFAAMVSCLCRLFPQTLLVVVGFSLGGNVVCKYLGETSANQERVLCCVSVCQGYSALRAQETFLQWDQCRRLYNFFLANNMKKLILSHRRSLVGRAMNYSNSSSRVSEEDLDRLGAATSLMQVDDGVTRKFHGYTSLKDYYETESCVHYLHNVKVPLLLVNSSDDPLVHQSLLEIPRALAGKSPNVIFALTRHGGHMGFFEGKLLLPHPLTWMDRIIVEYSDAIYKWQRSDQRVTPAGEQWHCSSAELLMNSTAATCSPSNTLSE